MSPLRVYIDTSVIGGCFDDEFREASERLVEWVRNGKLVLLVSDLLIAELRGAPESVQNVLASLPEGMLETVPMTSEIVDLRDQYMAAGIVWNEVA